MPEPISYVFGCKCCKCKQGVRSGAYYMIFHRTKDAPEQIICRECLHKPEGSILYYYLLNKHLLKFWDVKSEDKHGYE